MNYTNRELLLLSNFVYIPACISDRPIKEIIDAYRDESGSFTEESVLEAARGGGMSCSDVAVVFTQMDKNISENPSFGQLSASRRLEENDVRAVCYTDAKDKDPVVVFRGTGGTKEAWRDNFEGAYEEDTKIQKLADEFVKNECGAYKDIVVTGHSKGGNLAQYVTVKETDMVNRCVSFDGQGFGDDFINDNKNAIMESSGKICSFSAYNDFVNILLTCIAGETIYVANRPDAISAHSSVTLLTENEFDENGDFVTVRSQGFVAKELSALTDVICNGLSIASDTDKKVMSAIAGSAVSYALTVPDNGDNGLLWHTFTLTGANLALKMAKEEKLRSYEEPLVSRNVYMDTGRCRSAAAKISDQITSVRSVNARIDSVRVDMAYTISSRLCAEHVLERVCENLSVICERLDGLSEMITGIAALYEKTETMVAALMYA